jgi:hypothetical protein
MNIGKNARERALPWGNFVGHVAFPKRSAAMLGQKRAFIQWGDVADLGRSLLRPYEGLPWPDTGGEAADGGEVQIFVEPDGGAVLRGHRQR